jgi:phosphohistidine phosphatase
MRTLYLLRHAKSSETAVTNRDLDRALDKEGRHAARLVGNVLANEELNSALALSSRALRTRETLEILLSVSGIDVQVRFDRGIYDADLPTLLNVISRVPDKQTVLILVGHNPGMELLVSFLTGKPRSMPAAALAKISIPEISWKTLGAAGSTLEWVYNPAEQANS